MCTISIYHVAGQIVFEHCFRSSEALWMTEIILNPRAQRSWRFDKLIVVHSFCILWLCSILWCNVGVPTGNARIWSPATCTSPPIGSPDFLWMEMEIVQDGSDLTRRCGSSSHTPKLQHRCVRLGPHTTWGCISKTQWRTCSDNMFGVLVSLPSRAKQLIMPEVHHVKLCPNQDMSIWYCEIEYIIVSWWFFLEGRAGSSAKQCLCTPGSASLKALHAWALPGSLQLLHPICDAAVKTIYTYL